MRLNNTPDNPNKTKRRLFIAIPVILVTAAAIIIFINLDNTSNSTAKGFQEFKNSQFAIQYPEDFERTIDAKGVAFASSDTASYGPRMQMQISEYAPDSTLVTPEKVIEATTRSASGKKIAGVSTEEKTYNQLPTLVVKKESAVDNLTINDFYVFTTSSVWKISFRDGSSSREFTKTFDSILETFRPTGE